MSTYVTEEEQVAQIKAFWHNYGKTIITAIVLGLLLSYGVRYWREYQQEKIENASVVYAQMLTNQMQGNSKAIHKQGHYIMDHFSSSAYASFAALLMAKQSVHDNDLKSAIEQLTWVISQAKSMSIKQVARLRAARIYLELKQPEQALKLLETIDDLAFEPVVKEVQGDAYIALGDKQKARKMYTLAAETLPKVDTLASPLLEMKLDDLGGKLDNPNAVKT